MFQLKGLKQILSLFICLGSLLFLSTQCSIPTILDYAPRLEPIPVTDPTPLLLDEVIVQIEDGTLLGQHHEDYLRIPRMQYNWIMNFYMPRFLFESIITAEMKAAGYNFVKKDPLWEDIPKELPEHFVLSCEITHIT